LFFVRYVDEDVLDIPEIFIQSLSFLLSFSFVGHKFWLETTLSREVYRTEPSLSAPAANLAIDAELTGASRRGAVAK